MFKNIVIAGAIIGCASLTAAEKAVPTARWGFNEIKNNRIAPAVGKVQGRVMPQGEYKLIDGVSGKALQFSGKVGGVMLPKVPVDFTKSFTIVTTLKMDKAAAEPKNYRKFKDIWGNCGTRGPGIRLTVFYGNLQFNTGDGKKSSSVISRSSEYRIPLDKYFQLTVTYDGKMVTIYADGRKIAAKTMQITASRLPLCVGSCNGSAYGFLGAIDDLAIYDRALSAGEVAELAMDQAK